MFGYFMGVLSCIILFVVFIAPEVYTEEAAYKIATFGYMEGQIDALSGDIRVNTRDCSRRKSPRDKEQREIYYPTKEECKKIKAQ